MFQVISINTDSRYVIIHKQIDNETEIYKHVVRKKRKVKKDIKQMLPRVRLVYHEEQIDLVSRVKTCFRATSINPTLIEQEACATI